MAKFIRNKKDRMNFAKLRPDDKSAREQEIARKRKREKKAYEARKRLDWLQTLPEGE